MNTKPRQPDTEFSPKERFRLQFQQGLREYLARNESPTQGFGLVWEKTLAQVHLSDLEMAEIYWELVQWARTYDLFTSTKGRQEGLTVGLPSKSARP